VSAAQVPLPIFPPFLHKYPCNLWFHPQNAFESTARNNTSYTCVHDVQLETNSNRHVVSFLDLPDLAALAQVSPLLARLSSDPALHRIRILVVAPSRVSHSLFGQSPQGVPLRPTVGDLVLRGVMRGLGISRRWRAGAYFYSHHVRRPAPIIIHASCR
jgi:hypothetical protein